MRKFFNCLSLWAVLLLLISLQTPTYGKVPQTLNVSGSVAQVTEKSVLATPAISSITNTKTGAKLAWKGIDGADGYIVYRALPTDVRYTKLKNISSGDTLTYTDTSAVSGQPYHYTIRAYTTVDGRKTYSGYNTPFINVFLERPQKPTLTSTNSGVILSWKKITGANGYLVYKRLYDSSSYKKIGSISSSYSSVLDKTAVDGKTYYYALRAYATYKNKKYYSYKKVLTNVITYQKTVPETPEDTDTGSTVYRALLIGECNYDDPSVKDLTGPAYDVRTMANALSGMGYKKIVKKTDLTKKQILSAIKSAFKDADSDDVSLFFYSGHGCTMTNAELSGSLICVDGVYLTPAQLASALKDIPGKVVILLDSCGSGAGITAAVGSGEEDQAPELDPELFNSQICQAFAAADTSTTLKYGALTTSNKFHVITSSAAFETSIESTTGGISFGWFTYGISMGIGYTYNSSSWSGTLPADTNSNNALTLEESYSYAARVVNALASQRGHSQNVQRYPSGSTLVVFKP